MARFIHDGIHVIAEAKNGQITRRYTIGPRTDEVLSQRDTQDNKTYYLTRDSLGSTDAILHNGEALQSYRYDDFGHVTVLDDKGNPTNDEPLTNYLYTGREYQSESKLYNYRNRFYHSQLGRFLQPDPIGFLGGDLNIYTYVGNNPVNLVDPFGLMYADNADLVNYRTNEKITNEYKKELVDKNPHLDPGDINDILNCKTMCSAIKKEKEKRLKNGTYEKSPRDKNKDPWNERQKWQWINNDLYDYANEQTKTNSP